MSHVIAIANLHTLNIPHQVKGAYEKHIRQSEEPVKVLKILIQTVKSADQIYLLNKLKGLSPDVNYKDWVQTLYSVLP